MWNASDVPIWARAAITWSMTAVYRAPRGTPPTFGCSLGPLRLAEDERPVGGELRGARAERPASHRGGREQANVRSTGARSRRARDRRLLVAVHARGPPLHVRLQRAVRDLPDRRRRALAQRDRRV